MTPSALLLAVRSAVASHPSAVAWLDANKDAVLAMVAEELADAPAGAPDSLTSPTIDVLRRSIASDGLHDAARAPSLPPATRTVLRAVADGLERARTGGAWYRGQQAKAADLLEALANGTPRAVDHVATAVGTAVDTFAPNAPNYDVASYVIETW